MRIDQSGTAACTREADAHSIYQGRALDQFTVPEIETAFLPFVRQVALALPCKATVDFEKVCTAVKDDADDLDIELSVAEINVMK